MSSNTYLRNIFVANKLTRSNFLDWYFSMRIILKQEKMLYVLENPIILAPNEDNDE
jgi:hypothetical protein